MKTLAIALLLGLTSVSAQAYYSDYDYSDSDRFSYRDNSYSRHHRDRDYCGSSKRGKYYYRSSHRHNRYRDHVVHDDSYNRHDDDYRLAVRIVNDLLRY